MYNIQGFSPGFIFILFLNNLILYLINLKKFFISIFFINLKNSPSGIKNFIIIKWKE